MCWPPIWSVYSTSSPGIDQIRKLQLAPSWHMLGSHKMRGRLSVTFTSAPRLNNPMSHHADKNQSFRLACDRCRAQKLRCTQDKDSTNSSTCQRCHRAKVQCIYSPRTRSGNHTKRNVPSNTVKLPTNDRKRKKQNLENSDNPVESASRMDGHQLPILNDDFGAEQLLTTEYPDHQWMHYENSDLSSLSSRLDNSHHEGFTSDVNNVDEFLDGANLGQNPCPDQNTTSNDLRSLLENSMRFTSSTGGRPMEIDPSLASGDSQNLTPLTNEFPAFDGIATPPSSSIRNNSDSCAYRLAALAMKLHQQLCLIKHEPWAKDTLLSEIKMKDYPIGDILHRSHELINIVPSLSSTLGHRGVEVPLALLILNCYVSLVRIYSVVFLHLSHYLRAVPSFQLPGCTFHPFDDAFEERQLSNKSYNRTYAAFHMLLRTLGRVEETMGVPDEFRCVSSRLTSPGQGSETSTVWGHEESSCEVDMMSSGDHLFHSRPSANTGTLPTGLLDAKLVEAVLTQEDLISNSSDRGLSPLRKHIEEVKRALRQKMHL